MARRSDGKFTEPKDKEKKNGGLALGVVMSILFFVSGSWFPFLPIAAFGFFKALSNKNNRVTLEHCREYGNLMGMRETITVGELSTTFGRPRDMIRRELQSKIAKEYFGSEAYLDVGRDCLCCPLPISKKRGGNGTRWADVAMEVLRTLRGDQTIYSSEQADAHPNAAPAHDAVNRTDYAATSAAAAPEKENAAKKQPEPDRPKSAQNKKTDYAEELERILNELYDLNERIQDEAVSNRIDRIGVLTASIFRVVIEKPERENDVRKFMNYYLPTTLKLLKAYSLMEAQSYQGDNITESRKRIEETLDMLIEAFERLLDKLFRNDALDIATDIDVLKTMVAGDGLSSSGRLPL